VQETYVEHRLIPGPRLDLPYAAVDAGAFPVASPTDNLLPASVARASWASARIFSALGVDTGTSVSETQAPIDLEAPTGKEIVFEYEQRGMGNFLGVSEAL
jgi:hypothetical protein